MRKVLLVLMASMLFTSGFSQLDSLTHALKNGEVSGYWRNFFMATDNNGDLKDWNALATGGHLKYETGAFKGFKIGIGYYTTYNLNVSDVASRDATTNRPSRYEAGLFDVQNLSNRELHLLGELYLNYTHKGHDVKLGRMKLKTPFLNPQDGRMIPTVEQGVWYTNTSFKKWKFNLGWITHIAPRSYSGFEAVANSMGIYPIGLNPDGTPSGYAGNIRSEGLGIASVQYKSKNWGVEVWDYFLVNVYNSAYALAHYSFQTGDVNWKTSGQLLVQNKLNDGGNADVQKAYVHDDMALVWGAQLQAQLTSGYTFSANFNQITDHGRYLFPREWGRESLFTFQKRERLEGMGDASAWVVDVAKTWKFKNEGNFKVKIGYGHYYRADAKDFAMNKYAIPANSQTNIDLFYNFGGALKGLGFEYLLAYKKAIGDTYDNPNFILNKVDMFNHNVIMNYRF